MPSLFVGAIFLCIFLKSFKISIDFIPYIRYNNKCKGGEVVSNRRNKKTDSHKDKMPGLTTVLAILEIVNTILEIFEKVCK